MSQIVKMKPEPYCPECGGRMALRRNRNTRERFWGCIDYPHCRGTRPIGEDGKPVFFEREILFWEGDVT